MEDMLKDIESLAKRIREGEFTQEEVQSSLKMIQMTAALLLEHIRRAA